MVLQLIRRPRPRLHIGSGRERLEGWVNIDAQALPGVDVVADVTKGLQFENVEAIFAEHFIEHLPLDLAVGVARFVGSVVEAVFERRGAAVDDQDFLGSSRSGSHAFSPLHMFVRSSPRTCRSLSNAVVSSESWR